MRLISTLFCIIGCLAGTVSAECTVATADSPALVNVRLGMSPDEAKAALRGAAKFKVKNDAQHSYFKSYLKKGKAKGVLTGARAFYLRFFQMRVYQIEIFYHRDYRWNNLDTLVRDYANGTGFSVDNFETKHGYAKAKCDGFRVEADYILNPRIELTDVAAKELVDKSGK